MSSSPDTLMSPVRSLSVYALLSSREQGCSLSLHVMEHGFRASRPRVLAD